MLSRGRISKPVQQYVIPAECHPRIRPRQKRKKPVKKANYQFIPMPMKWVCSSSIYDLHGHMLLKQSGDRLGLDTSYTVNNVSRCSGIDVSTKYNQKLITVSLELINNNYVVPPWQSMVERLKESDNPDYLEWADVIRKYSEDYENMLRNRSKKQINASGYSEEKLKKIVEESHAFREKLFQTQPCMLFRHAVKNNCLYGEKIEVNEKYIEKLGYNLDAFAAHTLREGIPSLSPNDSLEYESNQFTKDFFRSMFQVMESPLEMPTIIVNMAVKGGYMKKMGFRIYYSSSIVDNTILSTTLLTITDVNPLKKAIPESTCMLNQQFLEQMINREKQAQNFLQDEYNFEAKLPYTDMLRTCRIRELEVPTMDGTPNSEYFPSPLSS